MLGRAAKASFILRSRAPALRQPVAATITRWPYPGSEASRQIGTLEESATATDAWQKSCYMEMDFSIPEENMVYEAVQRFSAYNIGCLVTTDSEGKISGVISERDYITKIALLGRSSKETRVKEIATKSANLVTATPHDSIELCMQKMLTRGIRHLPLLNDDGNVIGMLSIKDCVKAAVEEKEKLIQSLSDFASGKGGHFVEG